LEEGRACVQTLQAEEEASAATPEVSAKQRTRPVAAPAAPARTAPRDHSGSVVRLDVTVEVNFVFSG